MSPDHMIIFVCEHGAAKSIIAVAYFNKLAREMHLNIHAMARGTNPDPELSPQTIAGLHADGLTTEESIPQKLSLADAESAERMVSFCELPEGFHNKTPIELWNDIPPVSESYENARDAILTKLRQWLK
jgi:arsenate reductase